MKNSYVAFTKNDKGEVRNFVMKDIDEVKEKLPALLNVYTTFKLQVVPLPETWDEAFQNLEETANQFEHCAGKPAIDTTK